jgi:putative phosphoesterase
MRRNEVSIERMTELDAVFAGVDLIVHCGDVYSPEVLDMLETQAPVVCVRGNGDHEVVGDPRVEETLMLDIEGHRIGVTHAFEFDPGHRPFELAARQIFGDAAPNIIICGDTHVTVEQWYGDQLLLNPGSPSLPNGVPGPGTVATLELRPGAAPRFSLLSVE